MRLVASTPVMTGMLMSMITTSGPHRSVSSIASDPLPASPTTSKSGSLSKTSRKARRIRG